MHARSNAAVKTDASQHPVSGVVAGEGKGEEANGPRLHARPCSNIRWLQWLAKIQWFAQIASLSLRVINCIVIALHFPGLLTGSASWNHLSKVTPLQCWIRTFNSCQLPARISQQERRIYYLMSIVDIFARTAVQNVTYCEHWTHHLQPGLENGFEKN